MNEKNFFFNGHESKSGEMFSLEIVFGLKPEFMNKGLYVSQYGKDNSFKVVGAETETHVDFIQNLKGLFVNGDGETDKIVGEKSSQIVKDFFNYELSLMDGGTYIEQGLFCYLDCYDAINEFYDNHRNGVAINENVSPSGACVNFYEISFLSEYLSVKEVSLDDLLMAIKDYLSAYVDKHEQMFEVIEVCMIKSYSVTSARSIMAK